MISFTKFLSHFWMSVKFVAEETNSSSIILNIIKFWIFGLSYIGSGKWLISLSSFSVRVSLGFCTEETKNLSGVCKKEKKTSSNS